MSMVLRLRQHNIGYTADGFYRSDDPTNSVKALKEGGTKHLPSQPIIWQHQTDKILTDKLGTHPFIVKIYNYIYTVGHKKRATIFWTITSAFLDGFQHFVYQQKKE